MSRKSRLGGPYLTIACVQLIRGTESLRGKSIFNSKWEKTSHGPTSSGWSHLHFSSNMGLGAVSQVLNPKWQLAGSGPSLPGAKPSHCRAFMAWSSGAMHCSCFHYCRKYMILWFHVCHALLGPQLLRQGAQGAHVPGQHSWKPGGRACLFYCNAF